MLIIASYFFNIATEHSRYGCIDCISIEACTTPTDLSLLISFQFSDSLLGGSCSFKTDRPSHMSVVFSHLTHTNIPLNDIDLNNSSYYVQCPLCPNLEYHIDTFLQSKIYSLLLLFCMFIHIIVFKYCKHLYCMPLCVFSLPITL